MKGIRFFLVVMCGMILVGGVGYWLHQVSQGEAVTVNEILIGERAAQKLYVKLKSVGGRPLHISKINIGALVNFDLNIGASMNYTFLEDIIVPPRTTVAIMIPDTYCGGKVTVKTLEGEPATGDGGTVVVEGVWPEQAQVDPNAPWVATGAPSVTIYGPEDNVVWSGIMLGFISELPDL